MNLGFRELDDEGNPIRRSTAEVAAIMGLTEKRCGTASCRSPHHAGTPCRAGL